MRITSFKLFKNKILIIFTGFIKQSTQILRFTKHFSLVTVTAAVVQTTPSLSILTLLLAKYHFFSIVLIIHLSLYRWSCEVHEPKALYYILSQIENYNLFILSGIIYKTHEWCNEHTFSPSCLTTS